MHYVMSDIHGCYNEFLKALEQIHFKDEDTLYILGDCVDRGYAPMKLLLDIMKRPNVIPLIGNHDLEAIIIIKNLLTMNSQEQDMDEGFAETLRVWLSDGGQATLNDFLKLPPADQLAVLNFISSFILSMEIEVGDKTYLLLHGGLEPFDPEKKVQDYSVWQIVSSRPDYNTKYYDDKYTITGHTPTILSQKGNQGTIIHKNNHIAIDCGCVFGYHLAVLCLETGEEYYIQRTAP